MHRSPAAYRFLLTRRIVRRKEGNVKHPVVSGDGEHGRLSDDISELAQDPVDRLAPFTGSTIVNLLVRRCPKCEELVFGQDEGPTLGFSGNVACELELVQKPVRSTAVHLENPG
jgi:hypothetical protein